MTMSLQQLLTRLWHSPTFTTWGSLLTRLLSVVAVLPLVLVKFSAAEVVVWQLFATLASLLLLLDFGLAPTFARLLSYANGGAEIKDLKEMRQKRERRDALVNNETLMQVFSTLRWLYMRCGLATTALLCVGGTWALFQPMSQLTDARHAWVAWLIVVGTSLAAVWGNIYGAALQGLNQIATMRRWEIATSLGQILCSFLVLIFHGGLLVLVISNQAWLLFNVWRLRRLLFNTHPTLRAAPAQATPEIMSVLWPAAWRSGVGMLMSNGIIQLSGVFYSQMAPAAEVAAYLLALRIMTVISQFSSAPFYSKLPVLAELHASGQRDQQLAIARRGMGLSLWVYTLGVVGIMWCMPLALQYIGSRVTFVSELFWCVMSLAFFVERLGAMHIQLYSLTNHVVWHIANGVTGVLLLALAAVFYAWMGSIGLPLAMLVAYAAFYCVYAMAHSSSAFEFNVIAFQKTTSLGPVLLLGGMSLLAIKMIHV